MSTIANGTPVTVHPFFHVPTRGQGCLSEQAATPVKGRAHHENSTLVVVFDSYRLPDCNCHVLPKDRAAFLPHEVTPV